MNATSLRYLLSLSTISLISLSIDPPVWIVSDKGLREGVDGLQDEDEDGRDDEENEVTREGREARVIVRDRLGDVSVGGEGVEDIEWRKEDNRRVGRSGTVEDRTGGAVILLVFFGRERLLDDDAFVLLESSSAWS